MHIRYYIIYIKYIIVEDEHVMIVLTTAESLIFLYYFEFSYVEKKNDQYNWNEMERCVLNYVPKHCYSYLFI